MDASTHTLDASARPYLLRALHQWCSDEGLTPYVAVWVDERVEVPRDFVQDNQIVLNVGYDATRDLHI
ncbi:MAG: stringent starvation protein B, partial [Burkholderiaceae bacterium]